MKGKEMEDKDEEEEEEDIDGSSAAKRYQDRVSRSRQVMICAREKRLAG